MKFLNELIGKIKEDSFLIYIISAAILILFVVGIYALNFMDYVRSKNVSDWGVYGDYVGGVLSPILTFTSLILIAKTFKLQRQDLREQQEDSRKQRFENVFFAMLNLHKNKIKEINGMGKTGHNFFVSLNDVIISSIKRLETDPQLEKQVRLICFEQLITPQLNRYFSNLITIIKYIMQQKFDEEYKSLFISLLILNLTHDEMSIMLYRFLYYKTDSKFLEESNFFEKLYFGDHYSDETEPNIIKLFNSLLVPHYKISSGRIVIISDEE